MTELEKKQFHSEIFELRMQIEQYANTPLEHLIVKLAEFIAFQIEDTKNTEY